MTIKNIELLRLRQLAGLLEERHTAMKIAQNVTLLPVDKSYDIAFDGQRPSLDRVAEAFGNKLVNRLDMTRYDSEGVLTIVVDYELPESRLADYLYAALQKVQVS